MGFDEISQLSHAIEDLFGVMREKKGITGDNIFEVVYKGMDVLGSLIDAINSKKKVHFKGIKTKIEVLTRKLSASVDKADESQEEEKQLEEINKTIQENIPEEKEEQSTPEAVDPAFSNKL